MTVSRAIDASQRKAAKAAGWAYLLTFAIVVYVNFAILGRLIVNDAAETARNILAHERLFRVGIAGDIAYCAGLVVLLTALYVILRPVSPGLALLATLWRLVWVLMWLAVTFKLFEALRLLGGAGYLSALEPGRLQALARLDLGSGYDYYYIGLLFNALASTLCGYLWFRSRYIPRWLAAFGIVSSVWCVACTAVLYVFPNFDSIVNLWWFDTPMAVFDIVLSFWLLLRGLAPSAKVESAKAGDHPQATAV
ncbi:MAG TPA: DUF4386 domain-containing protein [Candidatus Binatia bacterium]|nr:DUF4386 domain-containing protein [Candidatus Binatia bacterium]